MIFSLLQCPVVTVTVSDVAKQIFQPGSMVGTNTTAGSDPNDARCTGSDTPGSYSSPVSAELHCIGLLGSLCYT